MAAKTVEYRILVVDDNPAIQEDFRKILAAETAEDQELSSFEAALFGEAENQNDNPVFKIDVAFQGEQGLEKVRRALEEGRPYAAAFIDMRMPPGWDGVETIAKIWRQDPDIQTVICTAYSDYSWPQIRRKLGHSDRLIILKKPFDAIEVLQLADSLAHKWQLARKTQCRFADLENMIKDRTKELGDSNASLNAAQQQLADNDQAVMSTQKRKRALLEQQLRDALQNGELSLHYQPLIEIASGRIVSLEALVRWRHPLHGFVSPVEFIPLAEETGLILPLGEFVLNSACEQIVAWQRSNIPAVPVAVNVSAVQLQQRRMCELVRNILRTTGLPSKMLLLEITESTLISDAKQHIDELQELRDAGVCIGMDDFGTGYSSLSYLQHLPIDTLKIDRSFIRDLGTQARDEAILGAILAMAHTLGLKVVAEGVETAMQLDVLRRHGCEFAQGYFFSRPLPAADCGELLKKLAQRSSFTETLRIQLNSSGRSLAQTPALQEQ